LQCAAVCCSVLQCVAVRCSVLQCVAVCYMCCSVLPLRTVGDSNFLELLYVDMTHTHG